MARVASRSALHWAGTGLSLLGVVFVVVKFSQQVTLSALGGLAPGVWAALLGLALGYGLSSTLLAFAWRSFVLPCGAYVVSWLAGLAPGAPAGMGVRDFLFALLRSSFGQPELLRAILLARLVTIARDVVFYLLSSIFPSGHAPDLRVGSQGCDRPAR